MKMYEQMGMDIIRAFEEFKPDATLEEKMSEAARMGARSALDAYFRIFSQAIMSVEVEDLTVAARGEIQSTALDIFNAVCEIMFEDEEEPSSEVENLIDKVKDSKK
jgi:hypothetical protein